LYRPNLPNRPDLDSLGFKSIFQVWAFSTDPNVPGPPTTDVARYERMRASIFSNNPDSATLRQRLRSVPGNRLDLLSVGRFPDLTPNDTLTVTFAAVVARNATELVSDYTQDKAESRATLVRNLDLAQRTFNGNDRNGNGILEPEERADGSDKIRRFLLPSPPNSPRYRVVAEDKKVAIYWDKSAESSIDLLSGATDFEGYRIYRSNAGDDLGQSGLALSLKRVAQFDRAGNQIGFNNGFSQIAIRDTVFQGDATVYSYKYEFNNLLNGWQYAFNITAFDSGNASIDLESLESAISSNFTATTPGKVATERENDAVGVYPNPFYVRAAWSGSGLRRQKIYFTNLPNECEITIFTVAGDVVARFQHNSQTYSGGDNEWNRTYGSSTRKAYSGGEAAWDMFSKSDQALSTGLYVFSVKNLRTGNVKTGRFVVVR
jgi:hypothetical protein